jgi:hypothetical protein
MTCQPVPVHSQERVIRGQLGEPQRRGHRKTTKSCNNFQNRATACLFNSSSLAAAGCCRCCCTSCACACRSN